jgi:hypothetical protein
MQMQPKAQVSAISFQDVVGEFTSGSFGTYLTNPVPFSPDTFLQDIAGAMQVPCCYHTNTMIRRSRFGRRRRTRK